MKVLQLCCPQKTHFLSGRVHGRNKGEKPQTQYMHCHLLVDREPRPALPCPAGCPCVTAPSGTAEQWQCQEKALDVLWYSAAC